MTAFLFIPAAAGRAPGRRVNFADIANLFGEVEPPVRCRRRASVMRVAVTALLLLTAIADVVLVARSDTFANGLGLNRVARSAVVDTRL